MKLTFIGSSHSVPEPHRKCSCIMLETGGNVYFIDMGTSAIDALRTRNISVDAVKGVFITHMHGDHTNGLIQFVDLITWYFRTPDPVICLPIPEAGQVIRDWLAVTLNVAKKEIHYRETQPGTVFDDGVLRVTAVATMHCHKSFSYIVEAEGKTVLFTGDLKHPSVDFPAPAMELPLDLIVCEAAHFEATSYLPVFEQCNIRNVCVTHYSDEFLPSVLTLCAELNARGLPAVRAMDDFTYVV